MNKKYSVIDIVVLKYIYENEYKFVYQHIMAYRRVAYGGVVKRKSWSTHLRHTLTPTHVAPKNNNCTRKTQEAECTTCSDVSCCVCGLRGSDLGIPSTTRPENATFKSCRQSLGCYLIPTLYCLVNEQWIDDVGRWPSLEFGDAYTYFKPKAPLPGITEGL